MLERSAEAWGGAPEIPRDVTERGDPQMEGAIQYNRANSGVMTQSAGIYEIGGLHGMFETNLIDEFRQRHRATGLPLELQARKKPVVSQHTRFLRVSGQPVFASDADSRLHKESIRLAGSAQFPGQQTECEVSGQPRDRSQP